MSMPAMQPARRLSVNQAKQCFFCAANIKVIDYKDADLLRKFMNPQGKIVKRFKSGTCAYHQRVLSGAIKRARYLALVPFTTR